MTKQDTITFRKDQRQDSRKVLTEVYKELKKKGYNPTGQIVGYLLSDDPTYITSSGGARSLITQTTRDVLLQEIVEYYLKSIEEK